MVALVGLITTVIQLYIWALIISVIMTWLIQFNVINTSNRFVYTVGDFLYRITEPVLSKVRSVIPSVGGIDLSPIVVILLLTFMQQLIPELILGAR
jgi:YggT family protein